MNSPEKLRSSAPINQAHTVLISATDALPVEQIAKSSGRTAGETKKQLKVLYGLGLIEMEALAGGAPFYRLITAPAHTEAEPAHTDRGLAHEVCDSVHTGGDEQTAASLADSTETAESLTLLWSAESGEPAISDELRAEMRANCGQPYVSMDETLDLLGYASEYMPWAAMRPANAVRTMDLLIDAQAAHIARLAAERTVIGVRLDDLVLQHLSDLEQLQIEITRLYAVVSEQRTELAVERQAREALQEQFDASAIMPAAVGYVVKATKRPMRRFGEQAAAQSAAMAAARAVGRGEVFALVPVGVAKRGAEWKKREAR